MKTLFAAVSILTLVMANAHLHAQEQQPATADIGVYGFLDSRNDITNSQFTHYWRDIHGPLAVRMGAMHNYWQHHFLPQSTNFWPAIQGVSTQVDPEYHLEGLAEVTFMNYESRAAMGKTPAAAQLIEDEQNVFRATYIHSSSKGDIKTIKYDKAVSNPYRVITFVRKADALTVTEFKKQFDEVLNIMVKQAGLAKIRVHYLDPYNAEGWSTPNVNNVLPVEHGYHAILETTFEKKEQTNQLTQAVPAIKSMVDALHSYPVKATYIHVLDGKPTLTGLRGYMSAHIIDALSADNQKSNAVLDILYREIE